MNFSKRLYIDGQLLGGRPTADIVNPATESVIGDIQMASVDDALLALEGAKKAFPSWSGLSIAERAGWMGKLRDAVIENEQHLRECVHYEMGKSWAGTKEDYDGLVHSLHFYAEEISRLRPELLVDREGTHTHELLHQPVGVAAAFLAWNFPLLNVAYKIGPAMISGCPIVIKPSIKSPLSAYAFGELCHQVGLPAGVVNIVSSTDHAISDAITASTIPSLITLIGSTQTGMHVMRTGATSIKRYSMELGGNAPALIFADADIDATADLVCLLKYNNSGQICVTPNRVFVESSIVEEFTQKVLERTSKVQIGFDKDADILMGPVIDARAWKGIDAMVQDAVNKGADLLAGGGRPEGFNTGHYYAPTVLGNVDTSMRVYQEEVFGPVISIIPFDSEEEVMAAANDTDAGLTSYVFTQDINKAERCAAALSFGEVQINGVKYGMDLPHCGFNQAGIGVDGSHLALDDYLAPKRITRAK